MVNERVYNQKISKLRSSERVKLIEVERVVRLSLEKIDSANVLDVGTGSGLFAEAFEKYGLKVAGIDISEEMIQAVKEFVEKGEFLTAPVEKIPYPDNSFDLVFLGHVLHEADDQQKALQEAVRVAKQRVAILEWPYIKEESGPPLEHRISPEKISELAQKIVIKNIETLKLDHMVLIRIDV
ncbi:MAG: methyltransferase domain-containing protein [Ignavibacteriaceae bacterium]